MEHIKPLWGLCVVGLGYGNDKSKCISRVLLTCHSSRAIQTGLVDHTKVKPLLKFNLFPQVRMLSPSDSPLASTLIPRCSRCVCSIGDWSFCNENKNVGCGSIYSRHMNWKDEYVSSFIPSIVSLGFHETLFCTAPKSCACLGVDMVCASL